MAESWIVMPVAVEVKWITTRFAVGPSINYI